MLWQLFRELTVAILGGMLKGLLDGVKWKPTKWRSKYFIVQNIGCCSASQKVGLKQVVGVYHLIDIKLLTD